MARLVTFRTFRKKQSFDWTPENTFPYSIRVRSGLTREQEREVRTFIQGSCKGVVLFHPTIVSHPEDPSFFTVQRRYRFKHEDDAMLFKLKFHEFLT